MSEQCLDIETQPQFATLREDVLNEDNSVAIPKGTDVFIVAASLGVYSELHFGITTDRYITPESDIYVVEAPHVELWDYERIAAARHNEFVDHYGLRPS